MSTEKRPKLKRPYEGLTGDVSTGTIGIRAEFNLRGHWYFHGNGILVAGEDEIEYRPDLFELVDVCKTCQREVCTRAHWDKDLHARLTNLCHGHDEPKAEERGRYTDEEKRNILHDFAAKVVAGSIDLDPIAAKVINEDFWDLLTFDKPSTPPPSPPYPVPEDGDPTVWVLNGDWFVQILPGSHAPNRTHWRTREDAEVAAKAHAKLDEVLEQALNVAAGFDPEPYDDARLELDQIINGARRGGE